MVNNSNHGNFKNEPAKVSATGQKTGQPMGGQQPNGNDAKHESWKQSEKHQSKDGHSH